MTDTAHTPDDSAELAAAESEIEKAKAAVGVVEDKLLDGDPSVATADLIAAEHVVSEKVSLRDRLRQIQAGRAERADEKRRKARVRELVQVDLELAGSTEGEIAAAWDELADAVERFAALGGDYNGRLTQHVAAHRAVGPIDSRAVQVTDRGEIVYPQAVAGLVHPRGAAAPQPYVGDLTVAPLDVRLLLLEAVFIGARRAGVSQGVTQPETVRQRPAVPNPGGGALVPSEGVEWSDNGEFVLEPMQAAALHRRARVISELSQKGK